MSKELLVSGIRHYILFIWLFYYWCFSSMVCKWFLNILLAMLKIPVFCQFLLSDGESELILHHLPKVTFLWFLLSVKGMGDDAKAKYSSLTSHLIFIYRVNTETLTMIFKAHWCDLLCQEGSHVVKDPKLILTTQTIRESGIIYTGKLLSSVTKWRKEPGTVWLKHI